MIAESLTCDVVVVGAGMSGLAAARRLQETGCSVIVLDKGRAVGGRMATRRIGAARFDHGAQHFSARSPEFARQVSAWKEAQKAHVWFRSQSITMPGRGVEDRHAGTDGMRGIPTHMASGIDVRTGVMVRTLRRSPEGIVADGNRVTVTASRAAIVTAPIPQAMELLGHLAAVDELAPLAEITYDPCLAVMAQLGAPAGLDDGHLALEGPAAWIADNQHKGVSAEPAVTIHSSAEFAVAHLDADPDDWVELLVAAASVHLEGEVVSAAGHRWRYAQPRVTRGDGCLTVGGGAPIVLAGEVFGGARVEGAYLSGLAAADTVFERAG